MPRGFRARVDAVEETEYHADDYNGDPRAISAQGTPVTAHQILEGKAAEEDFFAHGATKE